ncbi:MAG: hypothetical protein M3040_04380 [Bacteroidota bacterium]|nr:hypothetical protein [Bacteroidota bacterium]
MSNIREMIALGRIGLIGVFSMIFLIKIILFFKYEKEWNSITFFHFTGIQLRMTVSKELRKKRKFQNSLTRLMLVVILFLGVTFGFGLITKD